jgi:CHAD domain-containing protein
MAKAKKIKGIDCHGNASGGIKRVLVTRAEELCNFREEALNWDDPEGVHSMRVASRRLRSAVRDFMPYLRKRRLASSLKALRDIADGLGEVRDQDVALIALEKIHQGISSKFSPAVKQLIDARKEKRDEARIELESILEKDQLKQLETSFTAGVEEAVVVREVKPPPGQVVSQISFLKMSRTIITDRLKELEKLSRDVFQPFEIEALHEMRIAAKRLRYAIELFQQCWGRSIASYAKRVARIQGALGDVHDCDVWIESLSSEINKARKQKQAEHMEGFVWLLNHFVKLRTRHLRKTFELWQKWEAEDTSGKLRAALQVERQRVTRRRMREKKDTETDIPQIPADETGPDKSDPQPVSSVA